LALLYALRYPKATRSVVLDGAAPLDVEFPRTVSADANPALARLREVQVRRKRPALPIGYLQRALRHWVTLTTGKASRPAR
jgi:pimeloyl-ACP methyl ester carboxylesterase